ncbi:MAG: hypothetical protein NT096_00245 [Proteobacteria bacterium]|nr:hypothetical protein [Pseudomonadota bacterium]
MRKKSDRSIIKEQDRMIGGIFQGIDSSCQSERRRQDWLYKAKKDAGYDPRISFDTVWAETLKKAQSK